MRHADFALKFSVRTLPLKQFDLATGCDIAFFQQSPG